MKITGIIAAITVALFSSALHVTALQKGPSFVSIKPEVEEQYFQNADNDTLPFSTSCSPAGVITPVIVHEGQALNFTISPVTVFSVGAINGNDLNYPIWEGSSKGPSLCSGNAVKPEATAPGVYVRSAVADDPLNDYGYDDGTSMAAPHVSGAFALLRQK
jgi:subtilisin family serine protease